MQGSIHTLKVNGSTIKWLAMVMFISAFAIQEKFQTSSVDRDLTLLSAWSLDFEGFSSDQPDPEPALVATETVLVAPSFTPVISNETVHSLANVYSQIQPRAPPTKIWAC